VFSSICGVTVSITATILSFSSWGRSQGSCKHVLNVSPQEEIKRRNIGWARRSRIWSNRSNPARRNTHVKQILAWRHTFSQTSMRRVHRCQIKLVESYVLIPPEVLFCYFRFENYRPRKPDNNLESPCMSKSLSKKILVNCADSNIRDIGDLKTHDTKHLNVKTEEILWAEVAMFTNTHRGSCDVASPLAGLHSIRLFIWDHMKNA
jgi:hypothetical protein